MVINKSEFIEKIGTFLSVEQGEELNVKVRFFQFKTVDHFYFEVMFFDIL